MLGSGFRHQDGERLFIQHRGPYRRHCPKILWAWLTLALVLGLLQAGLCRAQSPKLRKRVLIPDVLVHGNSAGFAVVVDKSRQQLMLFAHKGQWRIKGRWPCSTGSRSGAKVSEGDRRTPEGVYFATRHVQQRYLADTYGTRALPLDYPNWLDRRQQRTGSAIWLHGTNKPLLPRDSNGCVVLDNPAIDELVQHLRLNRTPVIIVDRLHWWSPQEARGMASSIMKTARRWQAALMGSSYQNLKHWYAPGAAPTMRWWHQWCRVRHRHWIGPGRVRSAMQGPAILRYDETFVMLFDHNLQAMGETIRAGQRKLYLRIQNGEARIIGETYQNSIGNDSPAKVKDPLFAAWQRLWKHAGGNGQLAVQAPSGPRS